MYGNAEKNPVDVIAWGFGLFLIGMILIVSGYMFVMYLKSQHKKNQLDEQRRIEEQNREQLASINQNSTISEVKESEKSKSSEKIENPESSKIEESSKEIKNEIGEKSVKKNKNLSLNEEKLSIKTSIQGSKEPITDDLSSKKSLTDLNPIVKPIDKNEQIINAGSEVSVEIVPKPHIVVHPPPPEKRNLSAEKAPGSSIGSDVSTYVISSQRSEMNNYNMLEAGRTPPTFSNSENQLHRTSSIDSFVPSTTVPSGTPIVPLATQNSETTVSMTTPPNKK